MLSNNRLGIHFHSLVRHQPRAKEAGKCSLAHQEEENMDFAKQSADHSTGIDRIITRIKSSRNRIENPVA